VERKMRALAAQVTQTAGLIDHLGADVYAAWVSDESFVEFAWRLPAGDRSLAAVTAG
jgi:hypothetical protein